MLYGLTQVLTEDLGRCGRATELSEVSATARELCHQEDEDEATADEEGKRVRHILCGCRGLRRTALLKHRK